MMKKRHKHDLAFLDGGEGVYCTDIDCDLILIGENLLEALETALIENEDEFWSRFWAFVEERADASDETFLTESPD